MKTIVKIALAATLAVVVGIWFGNSLDVLNQQAKAFDENAEVIHEAANQVMDERAEEQRSVEMTEEIPPEEEIPERQIEKPIEVQLASTTEESKVEGKQPFNESVVKETALKLFNSLSLGNENGKIEGYASKEEFLNEYFMPFMGVNMAHFFVDDFFYDEEDGVYIIGKYRPHLLDPKGDFEITQVDTDYYDVKQTIQKVHPEDASTIIYQYEYDAEDNDWDIWTISYEY
ncbi:hypothetical protein [Virgibacillus halodenitrificans]|uniref:hypothetical protein n=1 Tax=Virgibacillus halodenitrificans TaxID=1482 RepID=UPI000EF52DB1|nr:hypothetical protein [Virgibacillus halodenitrificans]